MPLRITTLPYDPYMDKATGEPWEATFSGPYQEELGLQKWVYL
jgi:hypothetical protein